MGEFEKNIKNFYKLDKYLLKNPSLHEEDFPWKVSKILPLVDKMMVDFKGNIVVILDVGGGSGLILASISNYIKKRHHKKVIKYALDLSPGMLDIQKNNNLDIKFLLNEDIKKTSLKDKEVDLVLMIDVLEHIINPPKALKEISRISKYSIFKVPLEHNINFKLINYLGRGGLRKKLIKSIGHVNVYDNVSLKKQISDHSNKILLFFYTNVFDYLNKSQFYKGKIHGWEMIVNVLGSIVFRLSPTLASYLFPDYAMVLVKL